MSLFASLSAIPFASAVGSILTVLAVIGLAAVVYGVAVASIRNSHERDDRRSASAQRKHPG
jgi:hypothetical protein